MPSLRLLYSLLCDTVLLLIDTFFPPHGFKPQPRPQTPGSVEKPNHGVSPKNPKATRQWRRSDLNRPSRWQGNQNRLLTRLGRYFQRPGPGTWGHGTRTRRQTPAGLPRAESGNLCDVHGGERAAPKMLAALSLLRLEVQVITEHLCHSSGLTLVRCASKPPSCASSVVFRCRLRLDAAKSLSLLIPPSPAAPSSSWHAWISRAEAQAKIQRSKIHVRIYCTRNRCLPSPRLRLQRTPNWAPPDGS